MPKLRMTEQQKQLSDELRKNYGSFLTLTRVQNLLGFRCPDTARKWVNGLPAYIVNCKKMYSISDIAVKLDNSRIG